MKPTRRERQARTAYERASDVYGRHIDQCAVCGAYHGAPLPPCPGGARLLRRMAEAGGWAQQEGAE